MTQVEKEYLISITPTILDCTQKHIDKNGYVPKIMVIKIDKTGFEIEFAAKTDNEVVKSWETVWNKHPASFFEKYQDIKILIQSDYPDYLNDQKITIATSLISLALM